jgi:hypothetical protein
MGFRFRKWLSSKGLKLYEGKKGVTSTSYRIAKGITYNTKRGLTIEIPGTDLKYNFGKRRSKLSTRKQQQRNFKKILPSLLIMALLCFILKIYTQNYTIKPEISRNSQSINTHM